MYFARNIIKGEIQIVSKSNGNEWTGMDEGENIIIINNNIG